jgi:hypothetical protein
MLRHFRGTPFLVGIALGLVVLYTYKQPKQIVYDYPHPHNLKEKVYKDLNGVCYTYTVEEVGCDANEGTLRPYPIQ